MVRISKTAVGFACLCLPVLSRAVAAQASPLPSPSADTELICPTSNPSECYPRLFQPTKDFQTIKEGQDIPPGLHVRMNIYTGEKEARLNIPMEGEDNEAVIEVPLEQAVVVVPQPEEVNSDKPALRDQVPQKPPAYEAVGKVQPPKDFEGSSTDSENFRQAVKSIKSGSGDISSALENLSELSHDIFYGSELAKDSVLFEKLACLMTNPKSAGHDHKAASVIGSATQNNPTSLKEIGKFWRQMLYPTCDGTQQDLLARLRKTYANVSPDSSPATLKAQILALNGLIKESSIRNDFLANEGMPFLLQVFSLEGREWNPVRVKVAQLVMDNFLDESMGAELGIWPTQPLLENKVCEGHDRSLEDGCWEHRIQKFGGKQTWAKEFLKNLKEQRAKNADSVKDREL
ncbi:hypothetical protein BP6252_01976 [Coleophoma cylindrospora]|uniref:Nucleotide exchange factor SIL1 n=1 Tax=Coleophoma cylindrospora TaxID=1849047 RepID=A0A3D8SDG4_9HELO|nr:hypothetical protein BP6252_01976 [Coleophoma cylindrospora]